MRVESTEILRASARDGGDQAVHPRRQRFEFRVGAFGHSDERIFHSFEVARVALEDFDDATEGVFDATESIVGFALTALEALETFGGEVQDVAHCVAESTRVHGELLGVMPRRRPQKPKFGSEPTE